MNNAMNTCFRCKQEFSNWQTYHTHQLTNTCYNKIVPVKTSNRNKAEIVMAWEYINHKHLIY